MPSLYPDQLEVVNEVRAAFGAGHKTVILQSPTGSGKSRMGAYIATGAINKGSTVLFDVPMKELRKQIGNSFHSLGIDHSYIAAGNRFNPFSSCWVSTTPTISNRLDKAPRIKFAIIDEGHQGGEGRRRLKSWLRAQGAKILILTATPERLDGEPVDDECDCLVMGKEVRWLIDNKRLSDYRLFAPSQPDLSQLRKTGSGEYRESDVSSFMESQNVIIGDMVKHYKELAFGKRNIAYCASVKHSQMVCQAFKDAGIPSAHIDGTMSDGERTAIVKAFARREIWNITNADLLLYGWDLAAASGDDNAVVESISDAKPTMSKSGQKQKDGRGLRYKPEPLVLMSHAGNHFGSDGQAKHGLPCTPVDWNWKGREKGTAEGKEKTIPCRQCPVCFFVMRPTPACVSCGHVFEVKSRVLETVEGELVEVTREQLQGVVKAERQLQGQAQSYEDLLELERRKGHKTGWADNVYSSRKGVKVTREQMRVRRAKWRAELKLTSSMTA